MSFRKYIDYKNHLDDPEPPAAEYEPEIQDWEPDLASHIDYMIPFPCVAQDIQKWIIETSIKPQPALAFMATMAILSAAYGRDYQLDGIKGNLLMLGLAESGEGKDWPLKACQKVLNALGEDYGARVYGDMASGAALVDAICEASHTVLMTIDEAGHYFSSINSKNSNQHSREIMPIITKLYTSASDEYIDKKRKDQTARRIYEPHLTVLGMSTERQILDTLKTAEVADGSLARFMAIFGHNNVKINRNRKSNARVPDHIVSGLKSLCDRDFMMSSMCLVPSNDYLRHKIDLEERFNNLAIDIGSQPNEKSLFKTFFYRAAVKSVQLSILIDRCQSIEVLDWCADIVEKSNEVFIKKFMHMASDSETENHVKRIERAIKEAGKKGISKGDFYNKTRGILPFVKKQILHEMEDAGKILVSQRKIDGSQKSSTFFFWLK